MNQEIKLTKLEVYNFKGIKKVELDTGSQFIQVCGLNGEGKSSLMDSVQAITDGAAALPSKPVTEGKAEARVEAVLSNFNPDTGTWEHFAKCTRVFKADGKTSLEITDKDGAEVKSPQKLMDKIRGSLNINPIKMCELLKDSSGKKKLVKIIQEALGVNTEKLDEEKERIYKERTEINKQRDKIVCNPVVEGLPETELNIKNITDILRSALDKKQAIKTAKETIERCQKGIEELQAQIEKAKLSLDITYNPDEKIIELEKEIDNAQETNNKIRANRENKKNLEEYKSLNNKSITITKRLEDIEAEKTEMLSKAKSPIKGLKYDETGIYIDGVPLEQRSTAERLMTCVDIALALNSAFKLIVIPDGSIVDEKNLSLIAKRTKERGFTTLIERVGNPTKNVGKYILIEQGEEISLEEYNKRRIEESGGIPE